MADRELVRTRESTPGHRKFWVAFALELLPAAPSFLIFTDTGALLYAYLIALLLAGLGWLWLGDVGAAVLAVIARVATLPIVWFLLYVLMAGFSCDGGVCGGRSAVAGVLAMTLASGAIPLTSALLLARRYYPSAYGTSAPTSA